MNEESLKKIKADRKKLLEEIASSEVIYGNQMKVLKTYFLPKLAEHFGEKYKSLFAEATNNAEKLYDASVRLSSYLDKFNKLFEKDPANLNSKDAQEIISNMLQAQKMYFTYNSQYISMYSEILDLYRAAKNNKKITQEEKDFFKHLANDVPIVMVSTGATKLGFDSCLVAPVQRGPRYNLLFAKELLESLVNESKANPSVDVENDKQNENQLRLKNVEVMSKVAKILKQSNLVNNEVERLGGNVKSTNIKNIVGNKSIKLFGQKVIGRFSTTDAEKILKNIKFSSKKGDSEDLSRLADLNKVTLAMPKMKNMKDELKAIAAEIVNLTENMSTNYEGQVEAMKSLMKKIDGSYAPKGSHSYTNSLELKEGLDALDTFMKSLPPREKADEPTEYEKMIDESQILSVMNFVNKFRASAGKIFEASNSVNDVMKTMQPINAKKEIKKPLPIKPEIKAKPLPKVEFSPTIKHKADKILEQSLNNPTKIFGKKITEKFSTTAAKDVLDDIYLKDKKAFSAKGNDGKVELGNASKALDFIKQNKDSFRSFTLSAATIVYNKDLDSKKLDDFVKRLNDYKLQAIDPISAYISKVSGAKASKEVPSGEVYQLSLKESLKKIDLNDPRKAKQVKEHIDTFEDQYKYTLKEKYERELKEELSKKSDVLASVIFLKKFLDEAPKLATSLKKSQVKTQEKSMTPLMSSRADVDKMKHMKEKKQSVEESKPIVNKPDPSQQ